MKTRFVLATIVTLAGSVASAQDYVQAQIDALFAQGYTHFSVHQRAGSVEIEAYAPSGQELKLLLDSSTGQVISTRMETASADEIDDIIRGIEERSDDDHTDAADDHDDDEVEDDAEHGDDHGSDDGADDDHGPDDSGDDDSGDDDHGSGDSHDDDDGHDDDDDDHESDDHDDD